MSLSLSIAKHLEKSPTSVGTLYEVLSKYKLVALLPEITRILKRKQKIEEGEEMVQIESPFPLSKESIDSIKTLVDAKSKEHSIKITPELLAGFKAKYRKKMYDASAERIIKQFESK